MLNEENTVGIMLCMLLMSFNVSWFYPLHCHILKPLICRIIMHSLHKVYKMNEWMLGRSCLKLLIDFMRFDTGGEGIYDEGCQEN